MKPLRFCIFGKSVLAAEMCAAGIFSIEVEILIEQAGGIMANKVEICGVNTAKLPVYKDAEMQEMLRAIKAGDE